MNLYYAIYAPETGYILKSGGCSPDHMLAQAQPGAAVVSCGFLADQDLHYVDVENQEVKERAVPLNQISPEAQQKREIDIVRDNTLAGGFEWDGRPGVKFQTNEMSERMMHLRTTRLNALSVLGEPLPDVEWWDENNDPVFFTAHEFLRFSIAIGEWGEGVIANARSAKNAL